MNEGHFWPSLFLQIRLDLVAQQVPCDDAVLGREAVDKVRAVEQLGAGREFVVARPQEHAQAVVPQQGELEACVAGLQGQAAHGGAGGAEGLQPRAEAERGALQHAARERLDIQLAPRHLAEGQEIA